MPDNISKLYNELKETYELGSEDDFRKYLSDSKNREALRKELESEYDVGDEAAFSSYLGFGQPQQAAQPQQDSGATAVSQAAPVQRPTQQQPLYSQEDLQDVHQWNQPTPKGYARDNAGRLVTTHAGDGGSVYATPVTQTPEEQAIQQRMSQVGEIYLEPESYSFEPDAGDGKMHYSWRNGRRIGQLDPGALRFAHIGRNYSSEAYTQAEQEAADMTDEQLIKAFNDLYSAYGKDSDNALTQGYGREDASRMMAYATEMRYRDIGMPGHARDYGNDGKPKSSGVYHYYAAKMNPAVSSEMDAQDKMSWDDRVAYLSEALKDKQARENVITIGRGTDEDRKALEEDKRKLLAGSMLYARDNGRFPEEAYNVVVGAASNATPTDTGFWNGFKSTFTQMWRDVKYFSGEAANLIADDRGDVIDAIKALDKYGVDAETKLAAGTLSNMGLLGMLLFDGDEKDAAEGAGRILHGCIVRDKDGRIDIDATRAALIKKLKNTYSWGDRTMRDNVFNTAMATQTEGDAAWWGQNVAQLVPSAAAVVVGVTTRNPALAQAVGQLGMGYMCISSGSNAMQEARLYGATDGQVWTAGIVNAALEYATERVPFDRYTKRVFGEVKATSARKLMDAVVDVNNPAHHEIQQLLTAARKELGNGKLAKAYAGDILAEGTSEFAAGTLQKAAEILYKNPEDYPTFMEILEEGIESFKGGAAMGGIMGSISTGATYFEADNRRKKAGAVTVGIYDSGDGMGVPIEIVGQDSNGNYVAIDGQHKEVIVKPEEVQGVTTFSYDEWKKGEAQHRQDESYNEGYNAPDEEQAGVKERVDVARQRLRDLGFNDYQIEYLEGLDEQGILDEFSEMESWEGEGADAAREFLNARAAYDGMLQHVQDDVDTAIAESDAAVDQQTHPETGAVHHAVLKTGGEVWVVGGNVALTPEGNIDIENSDGDLIVLDPATGGKRMIHISDLASADEPVMADQLKQDAAATIQETMATDASNRIDGVLPFQPGDEYTLPFGEEQHTITIIGDAGDGVNTVVSVDGGEQQLMPMQMIQEAADAQREARIAEQAAMDAAASQQQPVEQEPEATEEVTEEPVEEEQPDEDAMPMNGDEVDWFATSPERGHRFLYDEAGLSPEEADAVVANSVKDAEKELEKVSKKAPKPGNAAQLNKYRAEKEAHEQQVAAAQAAVDYWKGVQATQEAIRQQAEAELLAQRAEEGKQRSEAAAQTEAEKEAQRLADREAARQEREALNGVPDVVNDKPEDARARGFRNVNGERVDRQLLTNSVGGRTGSVKFSTDVTVPSRIAVIEADELQPSHIEGQRNPLFFLDEAQPKNRTDQASDVAAEKIAKNINPEEITGDGGAYQFSAPTVNERGEVVQGNNRSSALKRMWSSGAYADSQQRYKQYLIDHAEEFGLNPQLVASMNRPVMVNEISVDDAEAIRLGQMSAKDLESGGIERIDPVTTARKLGPKMRNFASVLLSGEDENMSLAELIAANGEAAVKWLADRGVISPTQVQSAWNPAKTGLTAEAKLDLQNILRQQLFQGGVSDLPHMFEAMPAKAQKAILSTFMRDMDSADADRILPELQHAIEAWYGAASGTSDFSKATNYEAASRAMLGWTNVRNAFSGVLPSEKFSKFAIELANRLQGSSMRNMVTYFNEFYDLVQGTGVGDLFGSGVSGEKLTLAEAIAKIFNVDINETNNGQERSEDVGSDRGDGQEGRQGEPGDAAGTEPAAPGAGTPERGGRAESNDQSVAQAEAEVDTEPTDGQKEAGNYKKGHVKIDGFDVTIEQPKGSVRSGVDASGKAWSQEMHNTYGYIRGTEGVDGDHIDVFLSDHLDSWNGMVYVVDQVNKDGSFDEHKVMYGFDSEQEARDAYLSNYEEGWTGLGNITGVTRDEFKKWVDSSHRKTKPFAEYKSVKVSRPIQGLEGYTEQDVTDSVRLFVEEQLANAGIEGVTIKGIALHGSRMRGDARPDSDLDVVVEYEGDISEDGLFNLLNEEPMYLEGIKVDINPITKGKSGTLEQYMERSRRYDEEKQNADKAGAHETAPQAENEMKPVEEPSSQPYTITPTKYTTKKNKELDVWLVKFSGEIDKKQATEIAKETRGWWDREQGGFLMRSEEAARDLAERVAGATSQSDAIPEQPAEIDVDGELERASSLLALSNADIGGWQEADKIVKRVADHLRDKVGNMTDKELSDMRTLILSKVKKVRSVNGKTHIAPALQVVEGERKNREQLNDPELEQKAREQARRFVELNPDRVEEHIKDMENRYITHADQESEGNKRWAGFYIDELKKIAAEGNKPAETGNKPAKTSKKSGKRSAYVEQQIDAIARELATREVVRGTIESMPRIEDMGAPFNDWINQYILEHYTDLENEDQKDLLHEFYGHTGRTPKENVDRRFKFIEDVIKRTKKIVETEQAQAAASENASKPASKEPFSVGERVFYKNVEHEVTGVNADGTLELTTNTTGVLPITHMNISPDEVRKPGSEQSIKFFHDAFVEHIKQKGLSAENCKAILAEVEKQIDDLAPQIEGGTTTATKAEEMARLLGMRQALTEKIDGSGRVSNATNKTKQEPSQSAGTDNQATTNQAGPKRLVSDDRMAELKERLRKKLGGQLNVGVDPELLAIGAELAVGHIERGLTKFADYAKAMLEDVGDVIRPYLKSFYNAVREMPEAEEYAEAMTPYDEVRKFDIANFDKEGPKDVVATAKSIVDEQKVEQDVGEIHKQEVAAGDLKLRAATEEDIEAGKQLYHNGEPVFAVMVTHQGHQTDSFQFTKPHITSVLLTNGKYVDPSELQVAEETDAKKAKKTSKKKKKDVSSQGVGSLFDLAPAEEETNQPSKQQDNGLPRTDESRSEGLRSEGSQPERRPTAEPVDAGEGAGQERRGSDGRGGGDRTEANRPVQSGSRLTDTEAEPSPKLNQNNNHVERGKDYAPKDVDARIEANIAAIELMKKLIESGKKATPKEMSVLRKFSGWGGLGKAFNESAYGWREDGFPNRLRKLLGEEGYQQAVMSRNSAYYTPAKVIDIMWDIARALGFKGGNVLEGSAGIGNILGLMPTDMSERSRIHAVEIDSTTGNILSLLYPDAKVEIQGFEETRVQNGTVDLSITNVPFVTGLHVIDTSGDKDLSKKFRDIHDFCIAKNVRKLREGGIGIFITSSGTLDNSQKLRDWIVSEGNSDVVGAFRLNNSTFGGTAATSDIIVVRKRVNGQKSPNAIDVSTVTGVRTVEHETGEYRTVKGKQVAVTKPMTLEYNRYFVEHPEMMGGEMAFGFEKGETYRETSKALYPKRGINQDERLRAFVEDIASKDWSDSRGNTAAQETATEQPVYEELGEGVKEGSMLVDGKGQLCVARYGQAVPLEVNANKVKGRTKAQCFQDYCAIKDAVNAVLDYQTEHDDDADLQPLLDKLNKVFDDFVNTYGHFHKNTALSFLKNDMDFSSIAALEDMKERNDEQGKRVRTFKKSDIFTKRVVEKETEPKPTTIKDGVITSIYKFGRVDVPYISEQLGMGADEVKATIVQEGLGFENPMSREIEVSYEYLSGNVREKLRQAIENNEDGQYDANVKALEAVIPMNIPAHLIEFTLGSSWLDPKLYSDFIKERTGVNARVALIGGTWIVDVPGYYFTEQNRAMGVESEMCGKVVYGHELIAAALQNKTVRVSKTTKFRDGGSETIVDKVASQACATKIDEIRQDFKDWAREKMQSDPDMSAQIEEVYNESFNNYVPREIPDSFVPDYFGGASHHIKLRPHQAKAAIRATTQNVMLAHEVGTGKTFTLITTAMEMRRLGTARKPMIVVQNATVGQFVASAKELYPKAKVLTLEDADRTAEGRKAFYAKIKYNDWDMIVIPQSAFEMIPDSEERQMNFVRDKIDEKMLVLEQMEKAGVDTKSMAYKQAEREVEKLEEELNIIAGAASEKRKQRDEKREVKTRQNAAVQAREMLDRKVDDVEDFDQMGIDAILVDEAHEYKHLGFATAMQRGVKGVDPSYSKKSQGVFLKCQAVMERTGGKNVVFATGTPISNTAAEIWTFMRYLYPAETLKDYGIYYFDDFVRNFGNISQMLEFATNGRFKENNRFAGYVNLPELVRIWSGVSDTVLTDEASDLKTKIPEMEGGKAQDIYLPQTRALRSVMKYVNQTLEAYENMSGKEKKENSHIPLTMYGIAKAAAVDVRLVLSPEGDVSGHESSNGAVSDYYDDPNNKTNEAVRQTLKSLEDTASYRGTVAIFADNYQNKQSGFNLYEDIRKKLIDAGVPADQIVVMKSGMSVNKKLEIFDKVNAGEIRVIMGSTFTLGTGVNIQERLHTLIHVDAPNRPMDYTQRNGRILRQGNIHKEMGKPVRVLRFGVEDSLDVTAYQRLKTKGAIADSIMHGKAMMSDSMENRTMEEDEDVFGDVVAQLSGSEYALLKNQAEREVRKLEAKRKQYEADQIYIHSQKPRLAGYIRASRQAKAEAEAALKALEGVDMSAGITVGKQHFNNADEMGDFIKEYNKKITEDMDRIRKSFMSEDTVREMNMNIGGFDFVVRTVMARDTEKRGTTLSTVTRRTMSYTCEALGLTEPVPVKQGLLRNAIEDIMQNVLTGKDARERVEAAESSIARNEHELEVISEREGRPFEQADELKAARDKLKEYEQLMKAELEAKEAKYADIDASVDAASPVEADDEDVLLREEDDADIIRELENGPTMKVYRSMILTPDGRLLPPMSEEEEKGKQRDGERLGTWYRSDERPDLVRNGKFPLRQSDKRGNPMWVAYAPYFHSAETMLNDQFKRAQSRGNLVVVECEIPVSELSSGYRAEGSKKSVGLIKNWKAGDLQTQTSGTRNVYLSRWIKPVRVVPVEEVAQHIYELIDGTGVIMPTNIVTPQLRAELEKLGVPFIETTNQGIVAEGEHKGEYYTKAYPMPHPEKFGFKRDLQLRDALVEGGRLAIINQGGKWRIEGMPGEFGSRYAAIDEWRERAAGNVVWYMSEDGNHIEVEGNGDMYEMMSLDSTTSGRKQRERMARQQATRSASGRRMVDELADKLGVKVRYVDDMTEEERAQFSDRQLRGKGWYNPRTGEVFINLGRHTRLYDILSTFLHETVAHKGLRRLFGKDFNAFVDNVYNNVNKGIRAEIDRMAEQQKSRASEAQRARHDDEHWRRVATEEYMAKLAERLDLNHPEQRTLWEKIRGWLIDHLRKVGVMVADSLNDNDLRGILWESYHNMQMEGVVGYSKGKAFRDQMEREAVNAGRAAAHETTPIAAEGVARYTGSLFDVLPQAGAWARMMSNMSERELFSEMAQDGPNVTSSYTEEYDRRHIREYNQACDEIQAQLERELPGYDRLLELLQDAEAQWADGAYKDSRRTGVLAAIDTISRALDDERADLPMVEEDNLYRDDEDDTDDVDVAGFDAGELTFQEKITAGMLKAAADNRAALAARTAAMQRLGGNLSKLRQAMARQREYDRGTVDSIVRLARSVMESGFFRGFSPYEVKRLMSLINHAAGREDITKQAGKVVDLLLKHQLLSCENMLHEQMRTRGSKLNSQGVEVQAGLDIEGQRMVSAMKHAINLDADALQQRIWDTMDRMGSEDQALADVAAAEYQGLLLAQQYVEDIKGSKQEENELRHELQNAKDDLQAGTITREQYNQFVAEMENAIRENRLERVGAYDQLTTALGAGLGASVQRAKEWREMQKERVNEIRHNANSDLEGVPADEHVKPTWMQQAANWSIVRFFMKPLANFDYMLRMLGRKNVNGEGYLWQRFMGGWTDAADREWRNLKAAHKVLDEKVSEVFGKDMRWSDLFALERKLPGMDVSFWDAGEEKVHTLSQGNMLYIYMVNKMGDGRMKLRKMGITEEDVETIRQRLDPRFIQLADWLQEDFLVNKRNDYNAVYQRMFGASMAAIEHYFPLKINSRSRGQEEDLNNESYLDDNNIGSTITGSIIKRKRNSLPLDVTGADAFDVVLGHLQDMEHWAAFAEFNRDLNTLLSYKRFRNRLLNMSSIRFGSGKTLWMNFKRTCAIASGAYRPKMDRDSVDTTLVNVAKGVTAAKISFRLFTAMKQLLSYPAYLSEASGLELIKSSNPVGAAKAWNWALNELPGFAQRWQSRQAGDSRLRESDADWGLWRNKIVETASRLGMSPNAFIDGLTVAMGAKAIYETKLKRYRKAGYTDELAKKKALRDASISYNETQQSNANAYLSAMQLDRSAASVALTVFRNASMGYQRRLFQSIANLKHIFTPGYKEQALEFMSKQMVRDGLNEQDAARTAARIYRRAKYKNLADFAIFGWVMQMAWNLGPYLPYLLMGDDDDDKKEMLEDAALHAIAGGIEGLSAGNVMSDIYNMSRSGQDISNYNFNLLPLMSDIQNMMRNFKRDGIECANDLVNLIVQAGVGVNPQTLTDWIAAGLDFADGNPELSHEFGLLVLRVMSVPQNQLDKLYIDELGMTASDAQKLNAGQMAERYTRYKKRRGSMFTGWAYGAAGEEKADEHYMKKFETKAKERVAELDDAQLEDNFNTDDTLRRKWIGQEVAKRAGGVDSYGSPDTDYGVIYERKRNYTDLAQDILIQVEKKKAKDAGDKERYKALDSAQKELTTIKKGKHTKTIDEPGLGEGFDDEVMTRLRERRKELLSELGIM